MTVMRLLQQVDVIAQWYDGQLIRITTEAQGAYTMACNNVHYCSQNRCSCKNFQ